LNTETSRSSHESSRRSNSFTNRLF